MIFQGKIKPHNHELGVFLNITNMATVSSNLENHDSFKIP